MFIIFNDMDIRTERALQSEMDEGLKLALRATRSWVELARRLGLKPQTVWGWKRIPATRLVEVERATGVPRENLRPDLYRRD
jgi:DNA-binding transcriptional regulator YdaS (Cro superfamily)